ncbi:SLC13 family permease [Salinifilum ghardaiensis]
MIALLLLALMFAAASLWSVNLGVLALVGAFVIGVGAAGLDPDAVLDGFPGDLFVMLVGVTYLFSIAQQNGSLQRIVESGMRVVGNRTVAIPWLMFAVTTAVAAAGALSAAAVAIVSPLAMRIAEQHRLNPLLMGLMVVQGATAGSFSPLSPFGAITNDLLKSSSLPSQQGSLFLHSFLFNLALAVVVFVVFGGLKLIRDRVRTANSAAQQRVLVGAAPGGSTTTGGSADSADEPADEEGTPEAPAGRLNTEQVITLLGIASLIVGATAFQLDVGFTALTIGLLLTAFGPNRYSQTLTSLPWSAIVLVCGVLTYVTALEEIGTIEFLQKSITVSGNPLLTALAAAYIGGLVSAFASTAGILGASIPLTIPLLEDGLLPITGTITAVAIASSVVDVSPMSTNGALLVANQRGMEAKLFFRKLLSWAVPVIALAPAACWLIFVAI